jgi:hypothetical protein
VTKLNNSSGGCYNGQVSWWDVKAGHMPQVAFGILIFLVLILTFDVTVLLCLNSSTTAHISIAKIRL